MIQADAALDESTKDVVSSTEAPDGFALGVYAPYSALITVPVLVAIGQRDKQFCGPVIPVCTTAGITASEELYYAPAPSVDVYLLPSAGHSINLQPGRARTAQCSGGLGEFGAVKRCSGWPSQSGPPSE
ncbi:hypothetical protein [Lentzea albidocapillata]|uniref:hypothetical protein n=1 Tax=Lentzea albidocapillata TaxID=40571 RepID=UPI001183CC76|nr:hypothetical protein [Lentzea albidocapillata]